MRPIRIIPTGVIFLSVLCITIITCTKKGDGFVSLFDGKTLNGWVIPEKCIPYWKVIDGVIENDGKGPGSLIWTDKEYKDFIFKVDWRQTGEPDEYLSPVYDYNGDRVVDENGNQVRNEVLSAGDSGVFLRGKELEEGSPEQGFNRFTKAQINIWSNSMGSGQIHGYMVDKEMPPQVRRGTIPFKRADKPLGEWNTFVIALEGEFVTIVLNGETVVETRLPGLPETGAIGLQQHSPSKNAVRPYPIQFRNIFIEEL